jgi:hypothetical protein
MDIIVTTTLDVTEVEFSGTVAMFIEFETRHDLGNTMLIFSGREFRVNGEVWSGYLDVTEIILL